MSTLDTSRLPRRRALTLALLAGLACFGSAHAEDDADTKPNTFDLGRVVVQAKRDAQPASGESAITREQLDQLDRETVGDAVAIAPGVNLSHNSRNEAMVYVRGFDPRQVPVFLDGIPQYVPYDGYIDFDRFTTFGLGEIHVAKGAASLKHGSVSKLVLKNAESSTTYVEGTDYTLDPISGELSRIEGGSLPAEANVTAGYDYADVSLVDSTDVIGGINESTGESEGLELIDSVFPQFRLVPGSILAPRFSEDPAVAVVMAAKADGINGLFKAVALADIPTEGEHGVKKYTDVPAYKQNNNLSDELLIVCWPKVKLGDRVFGLATHLTGLISQTDADREGVPYASPSNKRLEITSIGYPDEKEGGWKELFLGLDKCNYLNGEGIYTAVNWDGGMKSWGGRMSAYPSNTDPKDCQDAIRRFFNWYQSTFILTYFQKVDNPLTRRQIQTILKSEQIRLDGYAAREMILGGSISFDESDNPTTDLIDGIARFHLRITPPPANREIDGIFEFDTDNLSVLFS